LLRWCRETSNDGSAYKRRREYEKTTRDPNDRYLMVVEREKDLEEQGEP
jgi:hypothetical protein